MRDKGICFGWVGKYAWNVACARVDGAYLPRFGISTIIHEPSTLERRWLAQSSSAQADVHAVECLSTPCQFCARLCTSDCSKSDLVGGLDRMPCAHIFPRYNNFIIIC